MMLVGAFVLIFTILLLYAYFIEPNRLVVRNKTIEIEGWNRSFEGFRVVMVSDIHGGSNYISPEKIRFIVTKINEQDADIVVILGDFVSHRREKVPISERSLKMPIEKIVNNLKGIKAADGVFAVLGNHDVWYDDKLVYSELERVGIKVLENEVSTIEKNGEELLILGLKDHIKVRRWRDFSEEAKLALEKNKQSGNVIILEHSPDVVKMITGEFSISNDIKLYLAGHTHGGQVWFPFIGSPLVPSSYGQKYSYGHVKENELDMYITSGIGTSILPIRFLVPPEIVVLTVKAK